MGINSLNNLVKNRDAIRKIMAMDSNGNMNKILEGAKQDGSVSYGEDGSVNYNPKRNNNYDNAITNENIAASKLPKTILESFKKNPGAPMEMPASILDTIDVKPIQQIRENKNNQDNNTQFPNGNIDYSLMKTIINESIRENLKKYISSATKKIITESMSNGNNVQAVKLGEKFSFITQNGDVYEATLKYKTNINENKKK